MHVARAGFAGHSGRYNSQQIARWTHHEALKKRVGPLIFPWVVVRDRSARYPNAAYDADKFLMMKGNCRPVGYYKDATGRYDSALVRFSSGDDLVKFMSGQEQGIDRARAAERFNRLAQKIEHNYKTKGSLANDDERAIFKEAYDLELAPRTVLDAYCKNDMPMQQWLKRNYAVKIPTNA